MDAYLRTLLRDFAATQDPSIAIRIANQLLRLDDGPKPGYLAIGFNYEQGHTFSRLVEPPLNPERVVRFLVEEATGSRELYYFDEILIVKNGEDCPDILHRWGAGVHF